MQIKIHKGAVDLSGVPILTDIEIEINKNSKIAVVGRNGCGKTTLLRAISGEIPLSKQSAGDSFFAVSGSPVIGTLRQTAFTDESVSMLSEIRSAYKDILKLKQNLDEMLQKMQSDQSENLIKEYTKTLDIFTNEGGFYFEKEYEAAIKKFGFSEADKQKPLALFSGGQKTKIAFLKLLLSKPDLLLLDEPTNHLDIEAISWLEDYIASYKKAVVIVSHDRFFLDKTVNEVYEIEHQKTYRYKGNYSEFAVLKKKRKETELKEYIEKAKEIKHLNDVAERFRYKATKAKMAQSKLKQIERIGEINAPLRDDNKTFKASIETDLVSAKDALSVNNLKIGFDSVLSEVSFNVIRGDKIGIIGSNGLGKSTLLKTLIGKIPSLGGNFNFGANVKIGYFDQELADFKGEQTVLDNFRLSFPNLTDLEARKALGAFLFSGDDAFKTLNMLSGGERVRLALCKLFKAKPNFLILDEPTNHMDILSKEVLEEILSEFEGTLIFVSHDRYFIKKLSNKLLCFENGNAHLYEYGYSQYLENKQADAKTEPQKKEANKQSSKKGYTTPAKEQAKKERAIKKAEQKISELEEKSALLKAQLQSEENASDYQKLSKLQEDYEKNEEELLKALELWEELLK